VNKRFLASLFSVSGWVFLHRFLQRRNLGDWIAHVQKIFTGRMPFLSPNHQCHSTEGIVKNTKKHSKKTYDKRVENAVPGLDAFSDIWPERQIGLLWITGA